jgi:acid phosphatase type 7
LAVPKRDTVEYVRPRASPIALHPSEDLVKKKPALRLIGPVGLSAWLVAGALLTPPWAASAPPRIAAAAIAAATTVTVAAAGDIARVDKPGTNQKKTANLITSMNPDRVLELGDAQYQHGEYSQFLRSYDPTWGAFKNITLPVLGNHEYETTDADGYFRYFAEQLSVRGSTATDPDTGYYSLNVGDWHVVALNSNCRFASCSAQVTWLKNNVAADDHQCELVMYHDPGRKDFEKAAAAAGVDLILTGHRHQYERWERIHGLNVRLFVVGTGGESSGSPSSQADDGYKGYGVLRLDLSPADYTWKFISISGSTKDSGSDSCHD